MLDKLQQNKPKNELFDNIAIDIFLFVAAIVSMLAVIAFIHIVCRHAKLKALLTGIAFQPVKQAEAVVAEQTKGVLYSSVVCNCSLNSVDTITYYLYLLI